MSDHQRWTFPWEDRTPSDYRIRVGPAMSEVTNMTGDLPADTTANSSGNGTSSNRNNSSNSRSSRLPVARDADGRPRRCPNCQMLEHIGRDCPPRPIHPSLRLRPVRPVRRGRPRAQPPAEPLRCRLYDRNYNRLECANLFGAAQEATAPYLGLPATPLALPAPAITAAEDEDDEQEEEEEEREVKKEEDEKEDIKEEEEKEIKEEGEE